MSNNAPDYENLAFKPKMTWEELVEFAKDYGVFINKLWSTEECCVLRNEYAPEVCFCEAHTIVFTHMIVKKRTYEQMKTIIENMFDKVEK